MTTSPTSPPSTQTPTAVAPGAGVGRAALVVGLVTILLAIGQQLVVAALPVLIVSGADYTEVSSWLGAGALVLLLVAAAAVVLGAVGLGRPAARGSAGVGLGVGVAVATTSLVALVSAPVSAILAG